MVHMKLRNGLGSALVREETGPGTPCCHHDYLRPGGANITLPCAA